MNNRLLTTVGAAVLFFWVSQTSNAQFAPSAESREAIDSITAQRGRYSVVISAGSGLSYYSTHLRVPAALEQSHVSRFGVPATLRAMWYPDRRLRVGIETGWTTMYSYRGQLAGEPTHVYVSVVPILIVFSMPLTWLRGRKESIARRFTVTAGSGTYLNYSRLDYAGTVLTSTNSLGWMAAGSYTHPAGRRLQVAGELKWYDAVGTENAAFAAEIQLIWRAFSW